MQLLKLSVVLGLIAVATAGHHHGHASSYSTVVKHEEPHHYHGHHEHHEVEQHHDFGHHGHIEHHGHVEHHGHDDHHGHEDHHDHHSPQSYKFEYGVKDSHTGDNKNQWEHSDGHNVKGAYELHEADGTKRVVEYHADKHSGFNAVVKRIGHAHHPQVYGHHEHGHGHEHGHEHGHHGHAESWANSNLYDDHHHHH